MILNKKIVFIMSVIGIAIIYIFAKMIFFVHIGIYDSKKYAYTLIDSTNGKPINKMIAVAVWYYKRPKHFTNAQISGVAKILEVESDKNGNVVFPSWGSVYTFLSYIPKDAPTIYFYKPGYTFIKKEYGAFSYFDFKRDQLTTTSSAPAVKVPPVPDNSHLAKNIDELSFALNYFDRAAKLCLWQKTPKLFASLIKREKDFKELHLPWPEDSLLEAMYRVSPKHLPNDCLPPDEFIKRLHYENLL